MTIFAFCVLGVALLVFWWSLRRCGEEAAPLEMLLWQAKTSYAHALLSLPRHQHRLRACKGADEMGALIDRLAEEHKAELRDAIVLGEIAAKREAGE